MQRALLRELSDGLGLALLRVDVDFGARDVQVAAEDELAAARGKRRRVRVQRLEEAHLGGEVLAAVRHVDRRHGQIADVHGGDPVFEIELGVKARGPIGGELAADVEPDAGITLAPVPIAPVAVEIEEQLRDLIG